MQEPSFLPSDNPRVKPTLYPFRHCMPMQIRFTDIDMLGHLNNNVYLMFMDLAKIDYFKTVIGHDIDMHSLNMVVVHIDIDFLSATFFGQQVEVWTQVTHIGTKSLRMEQRVIETTTRETKAVSTTIMAGYLPETNRSEAIAPQWRRAIDRFEQHNVE